MIIGDMEIRLRADLARLQRDMTQARQIVNETASMINRVAGAMKAALAGAFAVTAIIDAGKALIEAQRAFDKLNGSLVTATGSAANAKQAFGALQAFAATTPFGLKEVTEGFIKLRNLGMTPSERALTSYGNTASAMGKSLNQMIEAVADGATGEFERLKEFGIKAKQNGEQVSLTFQGVTSTIANNATEIEKYLIGLGETKFGGGMALQAKTLDGAISNLGDTWEGTKLKFAQGGFGEAAQSATLGLTGALTDLGAILDVVSGAATKEGESVQEAGLLHKSITTVFETVAVLGLNVAYVFTQVGNELGGLAAQAAAVATGEFALAKQIGVQMRADAEAARKEVDAKSEAILNASAKARKAAEDEAAAKKAAGRDDLAQYALKQQAAGKSAEAIKKEMDAYTGLATSIREAIAQNRLELATGDEATASQKARIKLDQELASGKLELTDKHLKAVRALLDEQAATEKLLAAKKAATEQAKLFDQAEKDVLNWIIQSTQARLASRDALAVEYEMYGQSTDARDIALVAIKNEAEMEKFLTSQRAAGKPVTTEMIDQLKLETAERTRAEQATMAQSKALGYATQLATENKRFAAESILDEKARAAALLAIDAGMWQERITLAGEGTKAQQLLQEQYTVWYANQVAKPQIEEQRKFWESIDRTAHDTFVSIMDGSKGAAQRLKDTFKNVFFDWLYSMTLKKWIVNLQGQFSTSGAGAVASLAGGGDGGGIGGLLSAAKAGYTALSNGISGMAGMFSEGLHQFGATITSNVAALGEWMGGSVGEMLGSNALAIGNAGIWAGGIGAGLGAGKLISNGYSVAGNSGNGAVMIGTALGAIWGPLGSALGGAIGGLVNRAFGMGAKEVTGSTITGNLGATGFDGKLIDAWTQKGGWFRSDKQGTTDRAVDAAMATGLGDAYAKITAASRDYAKVLGLDADYITGRSQSLSIALTKDAAANEKAITDFFTGVANTVAGELVPGITQFSKEGEAASSTLQRLAVQYTAVDAILKAMGASGESAFGQVGVASLAARERLLTLTGGIDALASQTSFFAQNFLSEAERLAPVQDQVAAKMAELGFAGATTVDAFRNVVVGLQTSGALANEVGANAYAELLKIAPLFKVVADANAAAAQAQAEAAQAQAEAAKKALEDAAAIAQKLADINKPYQDRIAELQVELGYASAARVAELEAMDASTRSLYEHEQGLLAEKAARDKRNAEYDAYVAKAAQDEQARQAQAAAIAQQRAAMEIQLYNLTHTAAEQVAAARERELASIDPVLKGLQQQIYAQQDLADAAAIAAKAIEDAAARAKAIASERAGIERSILQLQGNTAELRKLELAALDPANRALQESYFALQDKMAAEQAAAAQAQAIAQAQAQAAEEARRAEEALKAVRQSATDSIFDEVKRFRGLIDGGGAATLAGAQSAFAISTAQARAGDLDAMKALPGLSKTLADLAAQNATSLQELRWIQATTAASLQQTAMGAAGQYGLAIPKFDQGTNLITRGGLAVVHPGEAVIPAASNGPYRADSGDGDMRAVLAELQALRQEVASFHRDNSSENRNMQRVADTLERVTDGADAMRIKNGDDVLEVTGA